MTPPTASAAVIKATQRLNCFYRRKSIGDSRRNSSGGGRRKSHGEIGRRRSSVESSTKVCYFISDSEVTPGSIEVWSDLPEEIKNDPSLAPFRNQYEKQHGISTANTTASTDTQLDLTGTDCQEDTGDTLPAPGGANGDVEWNRQDANKGKNDTASALSQGGDRTIFGKGRVSFLKSNIVGEAGSALSNVSSKATVPPSNNAQPPNSTTTITLPHQPNLPNHDTSGHDDNTDAVTGHKKMAPWIKNTKIGVLLMCWILFTTILMMKNEKVSITRQLSIPVNRTKNFLILEMPQEQKLSIQLQGPFLPRHYGNLTVDWLTVWLELVESDQPIVAENITLLHAGDVVFKKNLSDVWHIPLVSDEMVDFVPEVTRKKSFKLENFVPSNETNTLLRVKLKSTLGVITPALISYSVRPIDIKDGILYAACVLAGLYVLIIFEFVHRTFAAILASTMSVAILAILDERPSTQELISWIDVETLLLLFSMMVLVAILSETGLFDYLAVYAYKVTGGRVWPLINYLCFFTAIMSSFLDNVTTVLLMTPVTIRLCEVMELNPVPILMAMIIYSNVGGTLTPVGDPPNVIIASNSQIIKAGIDFTTFTMHMSIGILLVAVQTYIHLRLHFRNMDDLRHSEPPQVQELRHEISIWQRAAASLSSYSKDEDLVRETLLKKVNRLMGQLKKKLKEGGSTARYRDNLEQLIQKYPIRNRVLLVKSTIAVLFVIIVFFLHSIPELQRLSLGWTALLGAILLLILADREDMEAVLARVEWSTLLFFAALFILMEALSKLGLIDWIGKMTERVILSAPEESRLAVAILLILWVSAVASAFVDNIPLTTMMIRIATSLGNNPELNLPLQPLVWALAFGACLGGNGTLIGASANVVCAGVAEQHGYRFTFMEYFRLGFPLMIGSITVISGYLLVCHVALEWH